MNAVAIRDIITGEERILRTECDPVSEFGVKLHQLLQDMEDTMRQANGFGLAAPQIGVSQQVCIIDIGDGLLELVNPKITAWEGSKRGMEGCLSFPGVSLEVQRPERISVEANDRFGAAVRLEAEGLLARTICHEVDHLHGVLFFDRVDETDFFAQFLQQVGGFEQNGGTVGDADYAGSGTQNVPGESVASETAARQAVRKELQLIVDMVAEAAWKTDLALEMLQEYPELAAKHASDVRKLKKIAKQLSEHAEIWEKHCEAFDVHSTSLN